MPETDERERLRALASSARPELDEAARDRIAKRVALDGPRLVRRARALRTAQRVGGVLVALGLGLFLAQRDWTVEQRSAVKRPAGSAPTATEPSQREDDRACRLRGDLPAPSTLASGDGSQRFELGAAGVVVADTGTAMWLDSRDGCRLRLRLSAGKVSVRADDLGGGELRVSTPSADVLVHGTTFAVAHAAGVLTVDVHEGRVSVQRDGIKLGVLEGGRRLETRAGRAPSIGPLPELARELLLRTLAGETTPAVTTREPDEEAQARADTGSRPRSADVLVAEAESLWRQGEQERARERFRQAGTLRGATAEAAWLALARRELAAGNVVAAQAALDARASRFGEGSLSGEAVGIAFRIALKRGDERAIRQQAELLQRRHPDTPQGQAAARWLREHGSR